jgi:hypothetical protein
VEHCKGLSAVDTNKFLVKLANRKDFKALEAIYKEDFPYSHWAAGEACRVFETDKVVGFCKKFEINSPNWREAFLALDNHPKKKVIRYIKEVAKSKNPEVRFVCYKLCLNAGWNDLLKQAKGDVDKMDILPFPNQGRDEMTIGQVAKKYIRYMEK